MKQSDLDKLGIPQAILDMHAFSVADALREQTRLASFMGQFVVSNPETIRQIAGFGSAQQLQSTFDAAQQGVAAALTGGALQSVAAQLQEMNTPSATWAKFVEGQVELSRRTIEQVNGMVGGVSEDTLKSMRQLVSGNPDVVAAIQGNQEAIRSAWLAASAVLPNVSEFSPTALARQIEQLATSLPESWLDLEMKLPAGVRAGKKRLGAKGRMRTSTRPRKRTTTVKQIIADVLSGLLALVHQPSGQSTQDAQQIIKAAVLWLTLFATLYGTYLQQEGLEVAKKTLAVSEADSARQQDAKKGAMKPAPQKKKSGSKKPRHENGKPGTSSKNGRKPLPPSDAA